jgi:type II secretory pathway component PulF
MLRSNIPVVESIETIARQLKKLNFRDQILKIAELVEGGDSLSRALSSFPDLFSPFYIGMVKSGEASGNVPESLDYLADYLERQQDFTSKVIMAIIYPAFVLAVFFGIMLLMGIVVIPRFGEIFAGMGTDLPFLTRLVIEGATFVKQHWLLLVFGLIGLGFCGYLFLKSRETKKALDGIVLDLPILGSFFKKFFLVHIALNLSTLISGGVPISHALEISSDVVGNNVYKKIILQTRDGVRAGQTISSILSAYPEQFPLFFVQMTVVGEKTGHLEKTLKNVVTLYQKEVDRTLEALIKFLEPALIIFLGILVALLAFALFVPLFQRGMLI